MVTQSAETQHKVQQLDRDVQAIYELLGTIRKGQQEQDKVLEGQSRDLTRISTTQQRQYHRIEELGFEMSQLGKQMGETQATHHRHGNQLDGIDTRLHKVDGRLDTVIGLLETGLASPADISRNGQHDGDAATQ